MQFGTIQDDSPSDDDNGEIYIAPQRVRVQIGTDAAIVLGGPIIKDPTNYYYKFSVPAGATYNFIATSATAIVAASAMLLF